jgi:ribose 5-phosphate isomerase A
MIVPYGWDITKSLVEKIAGRESSVRKNADGKFFISDDGLYCLDLAKGPINDPAKLEQQINSIVGVVETGLFVNIAKEVVIGHADGTVTHPEQKPAH